MTKLTTLPAYMTAKDLQAALGISKPKPEGKNRTYLFPKEWLSIAKKNSPDYIHARTRRCMERLYRQYCELDEQENDENIE